MKKTLAVSLALLVSAAVPALAAPPAPQQGPVQPPRILVVDQNAILQASKVGQDIGRQVQAYSQQAKRDLDAQARALQAQGQALQQQVAILSPEAKAAKVKDFESKQASLQGSAQKKEALIQGGLLQARQAIQAALGPILKQMMADRGANMIVSKAAVVMSGDGRYDITPAVIEQLNQKLPTFKVQLVPLPAGMGPQQ